MGHDDVTHHEKVRGTFDELDLKRARGYGLDEWITVLQRLHIEFSLATMRDLFDRADANHDGVVTYTEYQKFAETYPTLLDSLYYRSKDYWTDVHQTKALDAARQQERLLLDREEEARLASLEAQQRTDQQDHRLQLQLQQIREAQRREEEAREMVARAHEITSQCRLEVRDRAADHAEARDNERAIQAGLSEARRASELAGQRVREADSDVLRAEEKLREIERLAAEQRNAVEALLATSEQMRKDLAHAQSTEQTASSALADSQRAVQLSGDRLSMAEGELEASIAREREANDVAGAACAEVARLSAQKDGEERELLALKDQELMAKRAEEEAAAAYREQQKVLAAMEAQNQDFNAQRVEVEREEAPLLEQEVVLREQRESLEDREARLRTSSSLFTNARRSPSPSTFRTAASRSGGGGGQPGGRPTSPLALGGSGSLRDFRHSYGGYQHPHQPRPTSPLRSYDRDDRHPQPRTRSPQRMRSR